MKSNNPTFQKSYEVKFILIKNRIEYLPGDEDAIHMSFGYHFDEIYIPSNPPTPLRIKTLKFKK